MNGHLLNSGPLVAIKMKRFKTLPALTIILSSLIIIGAGHGGGFLGLIEIGWLFQSYWIGTEEFSLSLS